MSIPLPFKTNFPLSSAPFSSRVESQLDASKNYFLVAFKPGFPLQAAELNEMQEIFYMQQTLTQTMFANWGIKQYSEQAGNAMTATPWEGCTPLSPDLVVATVSASKITVTCNAGWYLLKSPNYNGGFGVWVYKPASQVIITDLETTSTDKAGNYGMESPISTINCTKNSFEAAGEDRTLQDSSNINVINGPCGAARIRQNSTLFFKESVFSLIYPMLTVTANGTVASVAYKNGYIIQQVS
jgi:hypothetical protein